MTQAKSLLDQLLGAAQDAGGRGGDLSRLLAGKGGLATGALAGGLMGLLMGGKGTRKLAKTVLKYGGAAVVGGLAYRAWQDWQANRQPPAPGTPPALPDPSGTAFLPAAAPAQEDLAARLVTAMVAAAKADGHVTDDERARIAAQLGLLGLGTEARRLIEDELARPFDVGAVAALARTPEEAAEVYAASLLVVDPEAPAEKGYLAMLAARLGLDPGLVAHLHAGAASLEERG